MVNMASGMDCRCVHPMIINDDEKLSLNMAAIRVVAKKIIQNFMNIFDNLRTFLILHVVPRLCVVKHNTVTRLFLVWKNG